jgi:hypothetical protein
MKDSKSQNSKPVKQVASNKPRPEVRDDLDSRNNEEQDYKGDDVTHNKKETKEGHLKNRGKDSSR